MWNKGFNRPGSVSCVKLAGRNVVNQRWEDWLRYLAHKYTLWALRTSDHASVCIVPVLYKKRKNNQCIMT